MIQIRKILAPTDFSHHAEVALKYACSLAERFDATLHLLHVLPDLYVPIGPDPMLAPTMPLEFDAETETLSAQALARVVNPSWDRPPAVEIAVSRGEAVGAIIDYAVHQAVDMIVIATHGRTGIGHFLLGSAAERIIREAPCPVLTIRDRTEA